MAGAELRHVGFTCFLGLLGIGQAPDEHGEHRRQQQREDSHTKHSREHGRTQRVTDLSTRGPNGICLASAVRQTRFAVLDQLEARQLA